MNSNNQGGATFTTVQSASGFQPTGSPQYSSQPPRVYSRVDGIFALLSFILGYLYVVFIFTTPRIGLGAFIFTFFAAAFYAVYFIYKKSADKKRILISAAVTVALPSCFLFNANEFLCALFVPFLIVFYVYSCFVITGNGNIPCSGDFLFFELIKSVFTMPFSCFGSSFQALAHGGNGKNNIGKTLLYVLSGLIVTFIPTFIVISLLMSADGAFSRLMNLFFDNFGTRFFVEILHFIIGIPFAMYIFALVYSCSEKRNKLVMTKESCERFSSTLRFLPSVLVYAASVPLLLVYLAFFVSQSAYFLSAFKSILPDGFTFAEYARSGFFQLFAVSLINLIAIFVVSTFTKKSESKKDTPTGAKVFMALFSVSTLLLIATAISKMMLYIKFYGLTQLRVYVTWFMVFLAVVFLLILVRLACKKFDYIKIIAATLCVMFVLLVFCDVDGFIAKYNIDRYKLDGMELDMEMLTSDLSDSAVEYILPLINDTDKNISNKARAYLRWKKNELLSEDFKLSTFNFTTARIEKLLEATEIPEPSKDYIDDYYEYNYYSDIDYGENTENYGF